MFNRFKNPWFYYGWRLGGNIMAKGEMSQQLQDQINRLQQLQNQLQVIQQQRSQVDQRLKEINEALEELENATDKTPIYKSVGSVLIKAEGKKKIVEELTSNKESLDIRQNSLNKQEGQTRERINELQSKVQNALSMSNGENA
jgi:prefoldin beta subunit